MEPYHALNAANVLITKFSTIALEAMLFQASPWFPFSWMADSGSGYMATRLSVRIV